MNSKLFKTKKLTLDSLPDEILWEISIFLNLKGIHNFILSHKRIFLITQNDNFWKNVCKIKGYSLNLIKEEKEDWRGWKYAMKRKLIIREYLRKLSDRIHSDWLRNPYRDHRGPDRFGMEYSVNRDHIMDYMYNKQPLKK